MSQHATLSPERWSQFGLDQQILMIANEMNRARKLMDEADRGRLHNAYARTLQLVDLTVAVQARPTLRRELLRWRDLVAELYLEPVFHPARHHAVLHCLLLFTVRAARQRRALGV